MSYSAYPKQSATRWRETGNIPSEWEARRLKFAVTLRNEKIEAEGTDLDYMGLEHIESWTGKRIEDDSASSEGIATRFVKDDVLFGKLRPYLAKVFLAEKEGMATTEALVLVSDAVLVPAFLKYLLISDKLINAVSGTTYGAKMPRANWDAIGGLPILLPSRDEQQKIAGFLDWKTGQIDALMGKKKELLEKLKEKRIAVITQVVTQGLKPAAPMRDSGIPWLGEVPKHWEQRRLKFCVTVKGGGTPNTSTPEYWDGDIPWVSPKDMKFDFITEAEDNITELGLTESASVMIAPNTVLVVVRSGILRHTIPVALNKVPVAINQDMKALSPTEDLVDSAYLMAFIFGNQKALLPLWTKPGCTVESIEMGYMLNAVIPLPPIDEQQMIARFVDVKRREIGKMETAVESAIARLTEYRTALITAATTGKIDVRNVKIPHPAA